MGITFECPLEGHEMQVLVLSLTRVERILGGCSSEGEIWKALEMFRKSEGQEAWKKRAVTGLRTAWESSLMTKKGHELA